jgi:hypothetical protein
MFGTTHRFWRTVGGVLGGLVVGVGVSLGGGIAAASPRPELRRLLAKPSEITGLTPAGPIEVNTAIDSWLGRVPRAVRARLEPALERDGFFGEVSRSLDAPHSDGVTAAVENGSPLGARRF